MFSTRSTLRAFPLVLFCSGVMGVPAVFGGPAAPSGEEVAVVRSERPRVSTPAPAEELERLVRGERTLALNLHRALLPGADENLFFSPHSIAAALSIAYAGAAGETASAFERVLGTGLPAPEFHRAMNTLERALASRGQGARGTDEQPFRLHTVNQLFAQEGFSIEQPFLDILAQEYGADVRLLDFMMEPEAAKTAVNRWVSQNTEGRIPSLLDRVTPDTRLMLVNAIYFNAAWAHQFSEATTTEGAFRLLDGGTKRVSFMRDFNLPARAATVGGVEVFELEYDGGELAMMVLVPPIDEFLDFERGLTAERLESYVEALAPEHLSLEWPKFQVRSKADLIEALGDLGLEVAFTDSAEFTGISATVPLKINRAVHEAMVTVDEQGTEAAAATGVGIGVTSLPIVRAVVVDRPFVFLVRDLATGAVVFLGRVTNP